MSFTLIDPNTVQGQSAYIRSLAFSMYAIAAGGGGGGGGAVSSVFGRTGAVVSASNDYSISQIGGLGTGVATALGIAIGSAGAPVVFNGALGTPLSGALTNCTGLPAASVLAGTLGTGDFRINGKLGLNVAASYTLDVSGTTGSTARFMDQTSVTGDTKVLIQAGAGQASFMLQMVNTAAQNIFTVQNSGTVEVGSLSINGIGGGNITGQGGMDIRASGFAAFTITNPSGSCDMATYKAGGTSGVTAGPFTAITSITVKGGIVTALTGT
jgi:hypothetical protein